jgi:exodeoxyribonuclease VII large subunit
LYNRERYNWRVERLYADSPEQKISKLYEKLDIITYNLFNLINLYLNRKQGLLREQIAKLYALSPHAILERGYSITLTIPDARVVTDPSVVTIGQMLNVKVSKGNIICRIERKSSNVEKANI